MKKAISLLLFILTTSGLLLSQNAPVLAPLNPDFVRFMEKLNNGDQPQPGTEEFGTGAMPPPGQISFGDYLKKSKLKATSFDVRYDMRDSLLKRYLTPVKGQTGNACWAFATMASVESQWLKLGLGLYDLSENNLKYCHRFVPSRSTWGNHWMSTAYFARGSGPLTELDDPNASSSTCPAGKIPLAYITDARYLPNDQNTIKQAILGHGAIYTMMYIDFAYYNAAKYTYYYSGPPKVNHAVDIIGWNDTLTTAAPQKGAWICRNSYGPDWGQKGYFYISYYDKSVLDYNAYWPARIDYVPDVQIYGCDDLGNYDSFGDSVRTGYMLVKYIASGNQLISKVGTYAMEAGTKIEIDVFDNFNPVTGELSGLISHLDSRTCEMPGYYTFDLTSPALIKTDNDFYIKVRYECPQYVYPVPIEMAISGYSDPVIESDIAWMGYEYSRESIYWRPLGNTTEFKYDPCVKAYAEPLITWTGTLTTDWNTSGNWSSGSVPTVSKNVLIPNVTNKPIVNQGPGVPAVCNRLTIEPGASLTIAAGKALTVNGALTNTNLGNSGLIIESGASLITKGVVNGTATIKRTISGNKWHFISSPVSDAAAGIFTGKYLQVHNESSNEYSDITSVSETLIPGKGYALWGDNNGFTAQYSGMLNTGTQAFSLSRTAVGINSGWNLAGNPYPSSIDWDAPTGWARDNVNGAIYIENNGGWATYLKGAGANTGTNIIAPGQGFLVNVNATAIGTFALGMTDEVRVHNETIFYKSAEAGSLVRLQVSGNGYTDEAIVRFMPEATARFDGNLDAFKLFGYNDESAQIYTLGTEPLTINSIQPGSSPVPLGIRANTAGNYTIAATRINLVDLATLEDTETGIFTDLSQKSYTFQVVSGDNENRFKLHFSNILSVNEAVNAVSDVHSYNQTVYISLKDKAKADIAVYTVAGQLVASRISAMGITAISIPHSGIYIVRVISTGSTVIKKVWVN